METQENDNEESNEVGRQTATCTNYETVSILDDGVHGPWMWASGLGIVYGNLAKPEQRPALLTL